MMHFMKTMWTGRKSVYTLPGHTTHSLNISTCGPTGKLFTLSFWVFTEASLHQQDQLHHWPLVIELSLQPLSPPQRWRCVTPHALPLFSAVRRRVQQPPEDPAQPGAGTPEEVARSTAGGGPCQGPQAAGHFPEE